MFGGIIAFEICSYSGQYIEMSNLEISFYLRKTNMCKIAFGAQYLRRNWEEAKLLNCY